MNKSESIKELATALSKFQSQVDGATKSSDNPFYKSKYADLAEIWKTIREPLTANGLSVCQVCNTTEPGMVAVETILLHESGEWISGVINLMLVKNDPQQAGSAITYARRYGLSAILGVHQEDDDANTHVKGKPADKLTPKPDTIKDIRLDISALVMELKTLKFDGYDLDERRARSYKKHLDAENPNLCNDINLLTIYRDHLKEKKEQAITKGATK